MNIMIALLKKLFQKEVMAAAYFFIIEQILTKRNGPVIDATKSYKILTSNLKIFVSFGEIIANIGY